MISSEQSSNRNLLEGQWRSYELQFRAWMILILSRRSGSASNDENPTITYEGIRYRLGLAPEFDVRGLVRAHGELFRHGIPAKRLEAWKQSMRMGKHLPYWIRDLVPEAQPQPVTTPASSQDT